MAKASIHFAYYLFLLTICIGEGDGRWKKSDKANLHRDIKLYKKIAERVEREYYADYYDNGPLDFDVNKNHYVNGNIQESSAKLDIEDGREKNSNPVVFRFTKVTSNIPSYNNTISNDLESPHEINMVRKTMQQRSNWPKFDDILLAIGKKYDWKNDRWIKVKEKFKIKNLDFGKLDNSIFHEKHRFSYRTIKLNRGKNKRNVVIAVTAIR